MTHTSRPPLDAAASERLRQLEALVEADPSDANYGALGYFLAEQGDPRGELVRLQRMVARQAGDARGIAPKLADAYLAQHRHELEPLSALKIHGGSLEASWENGYWRSVQLGLDRDGPDGDPIEAIGAVLAHPSARFLRRVVLSGRRIFEQPDALRAALDAIACARARRPVSVLTLKAPPDLSGSDSYWSDDPRPEPPDLPDTAPVAEAMPWLEDLSLNVLPRAISALPPGLRALRLRRSVSQATLEALAKLDLRSLELLSIHALSMHEDIDGALRSLLRREKLPALRELELRALGRHTPLLFDLDMLRGLKRLDLWAANLEPELARRLARVDGLDGLETLDLSGTNIQKRELKLFQKRPFKLVSGARVWDDEE